MANEEDLTPSLPAAPTATATPYVTLAIALCAGVIFCFPFVYAPLLYNRDLILHGQIWRVWTGHLVHYSSSHFLWNLIIFLAAGAWLEHIRPRSARCFYLVCPAVISASLLIGEPTLQLYAGLSGLASGVLVFLALVQLSQNNAEPTWMWVGIFGLVVVKIALETVTGESLLVQDFAGFRVVPLAHISGACSGVVAWAIMRSPAKLRGC
ncbi:MAG: rhombosortase [Opitutaceae bacterium]